MYTPQPNGLPQERETLVGVVTGPRTAEGWLGDDGQMDFLDAKGILETFLGRLRIDAEFHPGDDSLFMAGRCASDISGADVSWESWARSTPRFLSGLRSIRFAGGDV